MYPKIYKKEKTKKGFCIKSQKPLVLLGGGVWESNPPGRALPTHTGFEVRAQHQLKRTSESTR